MIMTNRKIRKEIASIERNSLDVPMNYSETMKMCSRCRSQFGRIFNLSAVCPLCDLR